MFADPFTLSEQDRIEAGELRWRTIGLINDLIVVLVAHTYLEDGTEDEVVRII